MLRLYHRAQAWALPAVTAAALLAGAPSASAATTPTIYFNGTTGGGGSVSYAGAGGAVSGNNIRIDTLFGLDTPLNDGGGLTCEDCSLSFLTGANAYETPVWAFSPGGSFTVTGTMTDLGITESETLLSGSFNGPTFASRAGDSHIVVSGSVDVTLNDALAAFYGTSTLGLAVMTQIVSLEEPGVDLSTNGFEGTSTATAINSSFSVVPVPATLPLFLSALAGIAMIGRRPHSASA
jgi:hypothetical protein